MGDNNYQYQLRTVEHLDYNSHADTLFIYFTSGIKSAMGPAGHSDVRAFPKGTDVVCRLKESEKKDGFYFAGLAEVIEFSEDGRPIKFGRWLSNKAEGRYWEPPAEVDEITDARK